MPFSAVVSNAKQTWAFDSARSCGAHEAETCSQLGGLCLKVDKHQGIEGTLGGQTEPKGSGHILQNACALLVHKAGRRPDS